MTSAYQFLHLYVFAEQQNMTQRLSFVDWIASRCYSSTQNTCWSLTISPFCSSGTSSTKQVLLGSFILIYPILYIICRVRDKKKYKNHIGKWQSTGFELEQHAFADWFIRNSYVSCHSTSVIFSFESIQLFCCCLLAAEQYGFFSANSLLLWLNARCVNKLSAWRVMFSGRVDSECVNKYCRHQAIVILKQFIPIWSMCLFLLSN